MNNIIEDLYFGNIRINTNCLPEYLKAQAIVVENEKKLLELLTGETKNLFIQLMNAHNDMFGTSKIERFTEDFKLGARFTLDTFATEQINVLKKNIYKY